MAAEHVPNEQPSIHDQEYWDWDLEQLGEQFDQVGHVALNEMDQQQTAEFLSFVWSSVLKYRVVLQQMALETAPKPARKRAAKVPKAVLPAPETDDPAVA